MPSMVTLIRQLASGTKAAAEKLSSTESSEDVSDQKHSTATVMATLKTVPDSPDDGKFVLACGVLEPGITYTHELIEGITLSVPLGNQPIALPEPVAIIFDPNLYGCIAEDGAYMLAPAVRRPDGARVAEGDAPLKLRFPVCDNAGFNVAMYTRPTPKQGTAPGVWTKFPEGIQVEEGFVNCDVAHFCEVAVGVLPFPKSLDHGEPDAVRTYRKKTWRKAARKLPDSPLMECSCVIFRNNSTLRTRILSKRIQNESLTNTIGISFAKWLTSSFQRMWGRNINANDVVPDYEADLGDKASSGALNFPVRTKAPVITSAFGVLRDGGLKFYIWLTQFLTDEHVAVLQQTCETHAHPFRKISPPDDGFAIKTALGW
ncbi:hypothetical protein JKP88DRAFT_267654 [Tribonema minus]|uniref:Uncharacterized protein n=1 Tax=Tribonema minus TaxID=303371 RepID=A0A836CIW3_9STRA|nr:hypothetical protein JKP88DRAFT_267654 [Tribonema minus]